MNSSVIIVAAGSSTRFKGKIPKNNIQKNSVIQGNLDPAYLVSGGKELVNKTIDIVEKFSTGGHIFNLGHGITPNAKIKNVELLIKTIKDKI